MVTLKFLYVFCLAFLIFFQFIFFLYVQIIVYLGILSGTDMMVIYLYF